MSHYWQGFIQWKGGSPLPNDVIIASASTIKVLIMAGFQTEEGWGGGGGVHLDSPPPFLMS